MPVVPSSAAPRQLVVCCDGTDNTLTAGSHDTNVLRLYEHLQRHATPRRLLYYSPGVGAPVGAPPTDPADWLSRAVRRWSGLASGRGVYENIAEAYRFLMHQHRSEDDRIFLFGFSRGAFTVRCVSGMVNLFGILAVEHEVLLPTLIRVYFSLPERASKACGPMQEATRELHRALARRPAIGRAALAEQIRADFTRAPGRDAWVHCVGVWDTVASVGLPGPLARSNPSTATLRGKRIRHARQALALDEHRWSFAPRLYAEPGDLDSVAPRQTLKQRWFPGGHADVGGGSLPRESALADATLLWIYTEALEVGLDAPPLPGHVAEALRHDALWAEPWWALAGMALRDLRPANRRGQSIAVIEGPALAPTASVWQRRRALAPLGWALLLGLLCLVFSGACLQPAGWRGLRDAAAWPAAIDAAAGFAAAQLASLWGQGLLAAGWPLAAGVQPGWAMAWDLGFVAGWGYWLARIGSRAFAALAGAHRPGDRLPWWRGIGMMPLLAVGGDVVEDFGTLAALALHAAGTDLVAGGCLWLIGVAAAAKLVGLAGCVPLLAVRIGLAFGVRRRAATAPS